jgi:teichuronic acid biosynthesis glycosyltransferase TuaG
VTVETSIIIPVYNAEKYVRATLDSVLAQTYLDWEAILVDDASTDSSLRILHEYAARDSRFRLVERNESGGAARARNDAIRAAHGRFIAFLDSDDLWLREKLTVQIDFMKANTVQLSYASYYFMTEDGEIGPIVNAPEAVDYATLLRGNVIACLTAVYDTSSLGKIYMPDILKRQDFGLWLAITRKGVVARGIAAPLAKYRDRSGSISSARLNTLTYTWKLYRDIEELGIFRSAYYLGSHLLFASLKRISK